MRLLTWLLALGLAASATARAQEPEPQAEDAAAEVEEDPTVAEARALFERGRELADQRRFSEAAEAFARSLELVPRPSTAFNLALCHYALGRHVEAIAVLERYQREADPAEEGEAYQDAIRMLEDARRSVGTVAVEVSPADAEVMIDGAALGSGPTQSAQVNPGPHVIRVRAPHHREALLEIDVDRGRTVRRAVQLEDERTPAALSVRVPGLEDARIEIDGTVAGAGMAQLELDAGEHHVRVTHPSIRPHEETLALDFGERASLVVTGADAASGSIAEEPAFWAAVGAVALAIAGGVALGWWAAQPPTPSGGSSGVVLVPSPAPNALRIEP